VQTTIARNVSLPPRGIPAHGHAPVRHCSRAPRNLDVVPCCRTGGRHRRRATDCRRPGRGRVHRRREVRPGRRDHSPRACAARHGQLRKFPGVRHRRRRAAARRQRGGRCGGRGLRAGGGDAQLGQHRRRRLHDPARWEDRQGHRDRLPRDGSRERDAQHVPRCQRQRDRQQVAPSPASPTRWSTTAR